MKQIQQQQKYYTHTHTNDYPHMNFVYFEYKQTSAVPINNVHEVLLYVNLLYVRNIYRKDVTINYREKEINKRIIIVFGMQIY